MYNPLNVHYFHVFFFFIDPATTEIYTLSLHDALPIFMLIGARLNWLLSHGKGKTWGGKGHKDWGGDRKSTRLNSSHVEISYAVFCLKKKNRTSGSREVELEHYRLELASNRSAALFVLS